MQFSLGFMAFTDMDSHGRPIQGSVWQGKKRVEWGIGWLGTACSLSKAWHGSVQYFRSRVRAWHNRVEQHGTTGAVPCVSDLLTPARLICAAIVTRNMNSVLQMPSRILRRTTLRPHRSLLRTTRHPALCKEHHQLLFSHERARTCTNRRLTYLYHLHYMATKGAPYATIAD
jgi:hypothetical protein